MRPSFLAAPGRNFAGPSLHDSHSAGWPWRIANGFSMYGDPVKVEVRAAVGGVPILHGSRGNAIALPGPNSLGVMIYQRLTRHPLDRRSGPVIPENR